MYGKIFAKMYEGTLYGHWEALVTFQQMIVLCDADGMIDMTPQAIASRTSIPLDIIERGIKVLEAPDPYSRSPEQDGRRIERIDGHRPWGWHLVNHSKYMAMQDADTVRAQTRERVRKHRAAQDAVTVTDGNEQKRHTDRDTDTDRDIRKDTSGKPAAVPPCPHQEIIDLYHEILPMGRGVRANLWNGTRAKHLQARWREEPERQNLLWWGKFFHHCAKSPFLTGKVPSRRPGEKPFEVALDWIIEPGNFVKIIEGKYDA